MQLIIYNFQVQGQLSLLSGGILTFGLTRYPYSEFELMAEELLMSDSTIKVFPPCWSLVMFIYSRSTWVPAKYVLISLLTSLFSRCLVL
jgi:hypothetical protein